MDDEEPGVRRPLMSASAGPRAGHGWPQETRIDIHTAPGKLTPDHYVSDSSPVSYRPPPSSITTGSHNVDIDARDHAQVYSAGIIHIQQILERSPNRFIYSQMISYPSLELTGAFETADEQYRTTPQATQLHLGSFKWIADAGHPLAKERYGDLLVSSLVGTSEIIAMNHQIGNLRAQISGVRSSGAGFIGMAMNAGRAAASHEEVARNYEVAQRYYRDALRYYKPDSIYIQQLRQKITHVSGAKQTSESSAGSGRCCCYAGVGFIAVSIIGGLVMLVSHGVI